MLTLTLDDRTGARELEIPLSSLGVPVVLERLDYGDIAFLGNGPQGESTVPIGIERKTIGDLLQCIVDGRLTGHQIPGMLANYTSVWLVVEGIWRENPDDGILEVYQGGWKPVRWSKLMASQVIRFLIGLRVELGIEVVETSTLKDTARYLRHMAAWWGKDKHDSIHKKHVQARTDIWGMKLSQAEQFARTLPGLGDIRSAQAALVFKTVEAMVQASVKDWQSVDGVGKVTAEQVWKAIRQEG